GSFAMTRRSWPRRSWAICGRELGPVASSAWCSRCWTRRRQGKHWQRSSVQWGRHMANEIAEAVKNAAMFGDVAKLQQLVVAHGGAAVRADSDLAELT